MNIKLIDDFERTNDISEIENSYCFYKKGYNELIKLLDDNISDDDFWEIIYNYYDVCLFDNEQDTYLDCKLLNIEPKRMKTDFILYSKLNSNEKPKYYFEDWIVWGDFDARRVYSEPVIEQLIKSGKVIPLYVDLSRVASKRTESILNNKKNLHVTFGHLENITHYSNWLDLDCDIYESPAIKSRLKNYIFNKDRIKNDIDYYRFRALELLKILRNKAYYNSRCEDAINYERHSLIKKYD